MQDNVRFTDSPHIAPGDLNGAVPPNVFAADSSLVWQARDGREHWVAFDLKVRRRVTQFVCTAGGERALARVARALPWAAGARRWQRRC